MASNGIISVLIAHPSAETVRFITSMLEFERDIKVVATTASADETLRKVGELNPQIVLIASELPDSDTPKSILQIVSKAPRTGVILISSNESPEFLRRCMQSGARFFLVMPLFTSDQLGTSIRDVCTRMETERAARARLAAPPASSTAGPLRPPTGGLEAQYKTVAFFGPKGGTGKTTLAVNVAVGLRQRTGRRVALVDADFSFGDIHLLLNIRPEHTILDYVEHIRDADADYVRSVMERHESGLRVLPAPMQPEHAELVRAEHLKPLLDHLSRNFDFVVIDCATSYDDRTLTLLDLADVIMVVTTPEVGPLHNTVRFLALAQALGYSRDKIKIILNRADSDVGITADDAAASLGHGVAFKVPSRGRQMALAANMGQPFISQNQQSEAGKLIHQICDFIAGKAPVGAG